MSPTDSQPKEKLAPAVSSAKTTPSYGNLSQPSLARRITGAFDDVYVLGWAFLETLLSPILDPSSWTRLPSQGPTPETPRPLFGSGGNRLGGGGGSWFGGGGGGGGSGNGSGGRRTGGFGTLGGLSGSGGTVDGCRGTCG